jgi:hypothetical protein
MPEPTNRKVIVSRRGTPGQPFGWEIIQVATATEVARSPQTFRSRHEALADGERTLRTLQTTLTRPDEGRASVEQ